MRGLLEVMRFELRYQRRSPVFYAIAGFFFLMTFFAMSSESVTIGGGTAALNLNAPYVILQTQLVFSFIGMFAAVAFVASAITRDYEARTAELIFTTGVSEAGLVLGRFFGSATFAVLAGTAALLGTLLGSLMPWLDQERVAAFSIAPFAHAWLWIVLPNYFLACALFYTAAALTRSISAAYVTAVIFLVGYVVASYFVEPDQIETAALLDPLGMTAFTETTRYWTVFQRNTLLPEGSLYANRAIWMGVALLFVGFTALVYRFRLPSRGGRRWFRRRAEVAVPSASAAALPSYTLSFDLAQALRQFASQLAMDVRGVVKSVPFYVILALGVFNVMGGFEGSINNRFGTPVYPVTSMMLEVISGSFLFIVMVIIMYYSGELVHRERQHKLNEIVDATPYPNVTMALAKIGALWFVIATLLLVVAATAVLMQALYDYDRYEIGLYLQGLFLVNGFDFFLLAVLAVAIQVLLPNKWFGLLVLVFVFILMQTLYNLGFERYLYLVGLPPAQHSDMNGYGHFVRPMLWYGLYWAALAVVIAAVAHLFFLRGTGAGWGERLAAAKQRFTGGTRAVMGVSLIVAAAVAGYIVYNTDVLNEYRTGDDLEAMAAQYEKDFGHLKHVPLPQVADVETSVDIYPEARRVRTQGTFALVNATDAPLDGFPISVNPLADVSSLSVEGASIDEGERDRGHFYATFAEPLAPGGRSSLSWDLEWANPGFRNSGANNRVVANGTFVDNTEVMPFPGYDASRELDDNNVRREHDLPPVQRLPQLGDPEQLHINQFSVTQRTNFRTVLSTSEDQTSIAPGYLRKTWTEGGRRYFTYEMDAPIWPFLSFMSARYEVKRDQWNDVALEVYYHPDHHYNVDRMLEASKISLDYFERAFTPYQYRQFRIMEFPGYQSFAQAFPNTVPFSESIGFVADLRNDKDIDYVFYVTAHELAHQWWGHQVVGARMQGMTFIIETLAQYSALMVMEETYGRNKMRRFLKHELDIYLRSRGGELIEELPLVTVENQGYVHYRKGSVAMYALKEAIGEAAVNAALRSFLEKWGFREDRYPTSRDLIAEFRAQAGEAHQDLITDLFERIAVYDVRTTAAESVAADAGFETTVTVSATKLYADGDGVETEAPMAREVVVGLYPERSEDLGDDDLPEPLLLETVVLESGDNTFTLASTEAPARVVVDPQITLVDRKPDRQRTPGYSGWSSRKLLMSAADISSTMISSGRLTATTADCSGRRPPM